MYSSEDGDKFWYKNFYSVDLHKIDGPAVEWADGTKEWYIDGLRIDCNSQEEFERYLNLIAFK